MTTRVPIDAGRNAGSSEQSPSRIRVLYVDDSALDRALVRDALMIESDEFVLTEVSRRSELEDLLADQPSFDLVLSDFNIMGMTGLDVLAMVRKVMPSVPIIIVTGTGSEEIAVDALKSGADDYVIKQPRHIRRLPQTIHSVLEARRAREERDRTRILLEESEFRFRLLAEHSMDLILRLDPDGRILYVSPASLEVLAREPSELTGTRFLDQVHPEDRTAVGAALEEVPGDGVLEPPTMRLLGAEDEPMWVEVRGRLIGGAHTQSGLPEVQLACRDITDRREMENTLRMNRRRLRQLRHLESVARLAGGIAHDFNNLLTVISGNVEMVRAGLDPGHALREEITEIAHAAQRAGELTRHLLEFSSGRMAPLEIVRPVTILNETRALMERALDESVTLEISIPETLPAVRSNPARLQQVLLNLALNARDAIKDAGRPGTIRITADEWTPPDGGPLSDPELQPWLPESGSAPLLRIRVQDDGCGMTPETAERVFEPFFTTKDVGKGTGLGLASSFGTIRQAGGTILVDSELGRGSTFTVLLPTGDGYRAQK